MAIFDLFSKRQKLLRDEVPGIYVFNVMSERLKVQIIQILQDAFGNDSEYFSEVSEHYNYIHKALCREYGVFTLATSQREDSKSAIFNYFLRSADVEIMLDIVELCFKIIKNVIGSDYHYASNADPQLTPLDAIKELNERFREHGVGYQFESDEIIRVDSAYVHAEIVRPTIELLFSTTFQGANEEYLKAHEHYRHGRNKECLTECLKAFESTMKIICKEKNWVHSLIDTASKLIQICFNNSLVPSYTQNQFSSLQNLLTSGIPIIRNKTSGHGQGQIPQSVDDEMTRYGLNLTGANIIFLVEQSGIK